MKSKPSRILLWLFSHAIAGLCAYEVFREGQHYMGAMRILVFMTWASAIASLFIMWSDEAMDKVRDKGRSVPAVLSHGVGLALVMFFVWNGWIATAIAMFFNELVEVYAHDKDRKPFDKKKKAS